MKYTDSIRARPHRQGVASIVLLTSLLAGLIGGFRVDGALPFALAFQPLPFVERSSSLEA